MNNETPYELWLADRKVAYDAAQDQNLAACRDEGHVTFNSETAVVEDSFAGRACYRCGQVDNPPEAA